MKIYKKIMQQVSGCDLISESMIVSLKTSNNLHKGTINSNFINLNLTI
jgi:hypothetical protein